MSVYMLYMAVFLQAGRMQRCRGEVRIFLSQTNIPSTLGKKVEKRDNFSLKNGHFSTFFSNVLGVSVYMLYMAVFLQPGRMQRCRGEVRIFLCIRIKY
jgi:hypothetical protein